MRFLTADYIFPVSSAPLKNGIIVLDDHGGVIELFDTSKVNFEFSPDNLEVHDGFLCPGFVNAHCHLELSHLKKRLESGTGLPGFLRQVVNLRATHQDEIIEAMDSADTEMVSNGIVAVGDISNTSVSIDIKKNSRVYYHTFVEIFDLHSDRADEVFNKGKSLMQDFKNQGLKSSIVPHAPYTVSSKLLKMITVFAEVDNSILCVHNQESKSEDDLFRFGTGELSAFLKQSSGYFSNWNPSGKSSMQTLLPLLKRETPIQFVHNTFSKEDVIRLALHHFAKPYWCFCPNANLFIESQIPDIPAFIRNGCKITLGTDSYASNVGLSILEEMKSIQIVYPEILFPVLLEWATRSGAEFLGVENRFGTFEKGKKPGINLVQGINFKSMKLESSATVIPLV